MVARHLRRPIERLEGSIKRVRIESHTIRKLERDANRLAASNLPRRIQLGIRQLRIECRAVAWHLVENPSQFVPCLLAWTLEAVSKCFVSGSQNLFRLRNLWPVRIAHC